MRGVYADIEERFAGKVAVGDEDECWEWTAGGGGQGLRQLPYGSFSLPRDGRGRYPKAAAHKVAFFLAAGYWGGYVCHTCDNPKCVNPNHLYDGSHRQNMRDMAERNRRKGAIGHGRGGRPGPRPTTPIEIAEIIRERYAAGQTQARIASEFGLTAAGVGRIVRGETRKAA